HRPLHPAEYLPTGHPFDIAEPEPAPERWRGGEGSGVAMTSNVTVQLCGAPKSVAAAIILSFFFGPLGMLYSTVVGGITIFFINLILGICTCGLLLVPSLLITWPVGIVWAAVAAANHNSHLSRPTVFRSSARWEH